MRPKGKKNDASSQLPSGHQNLSPSSNEVARSRIDLEVEELYARIHTLNVERNSYSPAANAVSDVLSTILLLVRDLMVLEKGEPVVECLRNMSHVCQHWRLVALNLSKLWDIPVFSPLEWTKEMLSRSQSVGFTLTLDFHIHAFTKVQPKGLWLLLTKCSYLRHLKITRVPTDGKISDPQRHLLRTLNTGFLTQPMKFLDHLEISEELWQKGTGVFSHKNFGDLVPPLRVIRLPGRILDLGWRSPLLAPGITSLTLGAVGSPIENISSFLAALQEMAPTLQQLDLRGSSVPFCPVDVDLSVAPPRRVHLEHLRDLRLFSVPRECLNVCRHLVLPPTTKYWLDVIADPENAPKVSLEHLLSFIVGISQRPVQMLEIVRDTVDLSMYLDDAYRRYAGHDLFDIHHGHLFVVLKFYDLGCASNTLPKLVKPDVFLAISWSSVLPAGKTVIADFCTKRLDISQLERLRLSEFGIRTWNPNRSFFLDNFSHLLNLKVVVVEMGGMPEAFIGALYEDLDTLKSSPSRPPAFPALKEIHIVGYAFASEFDDDHSLARDVAWIIHQRAKLSGDFAIQILRIANSDLSQADLADFDKCKKFTEVVLEDNEEDNGEYDD